MANLDYDEDDDGLKFWDERTKKYRRPRNNREITLAAQKRDGRAYEMTVKRGPGNRVENADQLAEEVRIRSGMVPDHGTPAEQAFRQGVHDREVEAAYQAGLNRPVAGSEADPSNGNPFERPDGTRPSTPAPQSPTARRDQLTSMVQGDTREARIQSAKDQGFFDELSELTSQEAEDRALSYNPWKGFSHRSPIGGVPSLQVMQQLEENATQPREQQYRGDIVGNNQGFAPQPQGTMRRAVGSPGGGTMVSDTAINPDEAWAMVWGDPNRGFTGETKAGQRQTFGSRDEAMNFSRGPMSPPEPAHQQAPAQAASAPPQPVQQPQPQPQQMQGGGGRANPVMEPTRQRQDIGERLQNQGLIGGSEAVIQGEYQDSLEEVGTSAANYGRGEGGDWSWVRRFLFGQGQEQTADGPAQPSQDRRATAPQRGPSAEVSAYSRGASTDTYNPWEASKRFKKGVMTFKPDAMEAVSETWGRRSESLYA